MLLRASGTEPLVRVMVEAADEAAAHGRGDGLCAVVEKALARPEHLVRPGGAPEGTGSRLRLMTP